MKINRSLIWDYDVAEKDLRTEAFTDWYLGRALACGTIEDIRNAGGVDEVRRRFVRLHLPLEVERLWSWYLGIPGPRAELYEHIHAFSRRLRVERSFPNFYDADLIPAAGEPTKVDFAVDAPFRLQDVTVNAEYGIRVDGELDLACNKLSALFDRAEAKDFVDVYCLLKKKISWDALLENARKKHVGLESHYFWRRRFCGCGTFPFFHA